MLVVLYVLYVVVVVVVVDALYVGDVLVGVSGWL